jgi:outer membrane protein assembly factor BamB
MAHFYHHSVEIRHVYLYCEVPLKLHFMKLYLSIFITIFIGTISVLNSQTLYEWRGPGRTGIYPESALLKTWPASGPALLWENSEVGTGYSSTTVTADAIYITGRKGNSDVLTAFTQDGKKKWEVAYGKSSESNYPDTRCTPTVSGTKIFLVGGSGEMVCISTEGKIIWSVNFFEKYSAAVPRFGISESPLLVGNKIIGTPGGNKAAMVAFNIENGNVIWETEPINDVTHYVNPILVDIGGKKLIITLSEDYIYGVDSNTGKMIWKFNYANENSDPDIRKNHTTTPIFRDGFLFVASGYNHISVKLKLSPTGETPVLVWKNADIDPHVGGAILLGNHLYSSTWETNSMGKWICVDWTTGKTLWITDWFNKGSLISADNMLYIYEEKTGHIGLVKPNSQKLEVISQLQISKGTGPYWAHPVIDKGRLFVRHGEYLAVYSVKSK